MKKTSDLEKDFKESIQSNNSENKIKELEKEILALRKTLEEYGIETVSPIDDVEYICVKGIEKLKALSENVGLNKDEANTLDILHKNLRIARGNMEKKEIKGKTTDIKDLLKIVDK